MTLIGRDGAEQITVDDLAGWAGTLNYEILCGISKRVPRILRDARDHLATADVAAMTTSSADDDPARTDVSPVERRLAPAARAPGRADARSSSTTSASTRIMLGHAMAALFRRPFRLRLFLEQMEFVGVGSLPIIMLVGFFSGAVVGAAGDHGAAHLQPGALRRRDRRDLARTGAGAGVHRR